MKHVLIVLLLCVLCAAAPHAACAAGEDAFGWELRTTSAPPGGTARIEATLTVEDKHFVYADMTSVSVGEVKIGTAGTVQVPAGKVKEDPFGLEPREVYTGAATFTIPITIADTTKPKTYSIEVTTTHQGCSETICYFPAELTHTVHLVVTAAGTAPGAATGSAGAPQPTGFAAAMERGVAFAFLAVFIGGVLTSLTPCVYPLIPITVSIFGAAGAQSRARAFGLSAVYVLGMACMYSVLGLGAAASGKVFGQILSDPIFVIGVATVFALFGLSMIGLFEIQLPTKWQTALSATGKAGPAGAFVMGLVAGIVAAPCTGPVLGAVLAYVATTRNLFLGFWLLFTYALGIGVLFLVLGTFAGLASRLPRSGPWMDGVKSVFGVIMFAMALFFLKEIVPPLRDLLGRTPRTFGWAAVLLVGGALFGAFRGSVHGVSLTAALRKYAAVAACAVGAYMALGSFLVPPAPVGAEDHLAWRTDLDQALADAKAAGKPAMIDFYADWCVACKELDAHTFTEPDVAAALERFVLVRVDLTKSTPENEALHERFGIVGLPHVTFVSPDGIVREELTLTGFKKPDAFLRDHVAPLAGS